MKKLLLLHLSFFYSLSVLAQTGLTENFNDNSLAAGWKGNASYSLSETNQQLNVNAAVTNGSWTLFSYTFSPLNLNDYPFIKLKIKSSSSVVVRIDLVDASNKQTNAFPITKTVSSASFTDFTFDFNGKFSQTSPSVALVDPTTITTIRIFFAPGSAFTGSVQIEDLQIGSNTGLLLIQDKIRINQLGFYPEGPKTAIVAGSTLNSFYVVSQNKQDTLYTGILSAASTWTPSGEYVKKADFSNFKTPGKYYLWVPGIGYSFLFDIKSDVHQNVSLALMKAFYFQRASTALSSTYAGVWARAMGHPDNNVIIHNSAASVGRPTGSVISSPKGWYDAGDYNKYIVNSGISTYTLLQLYEVFHNHLDTLQLNIPESKNNLPDILDEALWNIRWMLTMQDPYDGGVYHKLTNEDFDGNVMPFAATTDRYVVQKSTGAALNFAAVMAQSARIFSTFPNQLPGLADSCIDAAYNAWKWARQNPNVIYDQTTLSNPTITTGTYKDTDFSDEFRWAGFELYTTTKIDSFYTSVGTAASVFVPGWNSVNALGYYTLAHYRKQLTSICDTDAVKTKIINLANSLKNEALNNSAFGVSMTNGYLNWGSSGTAANQGIVLLQVFNITGDSSYYKAAIAQLDYLLGRNGTNYCFVTGFGTVSPKNIHSRISYVDGIVAPVPGLLAGGPNIDAQTDCGAASYPSSTLKGKAYLDSYCSYSTNEITINWNAPAAFLSTGIEAVNKQIASSVIDFSPVIPQELLITTVNEHQSVEPLYLYPNPVLTELVVEMGKVKNGMIQIIDYTGKVIFKTEINQNFNRINVSDLLSGLYTLLVVDNTQMRSVKFIKL